MADPYRDSCVICGRSAVVACDMDDPMRDTLTDFCVECIENSEYVDNFGRCYVCRNFHDHEHCVGVPVPVSLPAA